MVKFAPILQASIRRRKTLILLHGLVVVHKTGMTQLCHLLLQPCNFPIKMAGRHKDLS